MTEKDKRNLIKSLTCNLGIAFAIINFAMGCIAFAADLSAKLMTYSCLGWFCAAAVCVYLVVFSQIVLSWLPPEDNTNS